VAVPDIGPRPHQPPLGCDHEVRGIGIESLRDERLADLGTVRVSGIDEIDPKLHRPLQDTQRCWHVRRRTPDTGAGDAHGSESEPIHGEIAAEGDLASRAGVGSCAHVVTPRRALKWPRAKPGERMQQALCPADVATRSSSKAKLLRYG